MKIRIADVAWDLNGLPITVVAAGPSAQGAMQRTISLTEPVTWTTISTSPLSPGVDGSFSFTDTEAPDGTAYYRSAQD